MSPEKRLFLFNIEKLKESLAEVRLKLNTDYSFTVKYGQINLHCCEPYQGTIEGHAQALGIKFASVCTYPAMPEQIVRDSP